MSAPAIAEVAAPLHPLHKNITNFSFSMYRLQGKMKVASGFSLSIFILVIC